MTRILLGLLLVLGFTAQSVSALNAGAETSDTTLSADESPVLSVIPEGESDGGDDYPVSGPVALALLQPDTVVSPAPVDRVSGTFTGAATIRAPPAA